MRLPWPSRRSAGRSTGGAAAPAAGDGTLQPVAPPVGRSEWREVGALRPSFRADPGIRVQRFSDELAGSHRPEPILRPLGHDRSADGPAGLVSGLARPVISRVVAERSDTRSLPLAHRRAATDGQLTDPALEPVPDIAELPSLEPRHAPVVATPVVARRLTEAPVPVGPSTPRPTTSVSPVVQRVSAQLVGQATSLPLAPTPPTTTAGRALAADAAPLGTRTILRSPAGSRVRLGPPISGATSMTLRATDTSGPSSPRVVARSTTASTAGEPVGARPPVEAAPLSGGLRTSISGSPDVGNGAEAVSAWSAPSGLVLARVVAHPSPPVSRLVDVSGGYGLAEAATATTAAGDPADSAATGRLPVGATSIRATSNVPAPLVGADPLARTSWPPAARSGTTAGGAASTGSPSGSVPGAFGSPPSKESSRAVQRTLSGRATAPGTAPGARSAGSDGRIGARSVTEVSRTEEPAGPRTSQSLAPTRVAGVSTLATSAAQPFRGRLQRSGPAVIDAERWPAARALVSGRPTSGEPYVAASASGGAWQSPGEGAALASAPVTVQRDVDSTEDAGNAGDGGEQESLATMVNAGTAGNGAGASGPGAMPERDLETIAHRLYPRLLRRLSSELLVARERAGVLADRR
jgi:hypothetical protein